MKEEKKLYCVIDAKGDVVGRFHDKKRAVHYMIDYYFSDDSEKVTVKTMTTEEYSNYAKKLLDEYINE